MKSSWPSSSLTNVGRISAILAMVVLFAGKTVHVHQECGDCCAAHNSEVQSKPEATTCPFGCAYHSTDDSTPTRDDPNQPHDEHHCTICQLLAQAPNYPVLLSLPDSPEILLETIALRSDAAIAGANISAQPRGPPHAA